MDKSKLRIAAVMLGVMGILGGLVWSADADKKKHQGQNEGHVRQVVAMVTTAKITAEQAMKTALNHFPGTVIEVVLDKMYDKTLWEVEILTGEQAILVVQIDAELGLVLATEEKMVGKRQEHKQKS